MPDNHWDYRDRGMRADLIATLGTSKNKNENRFSIWLKSNTITDTDNLPRTIGYGCTKNSWLNNPTIAGINEWISL